MLLSSFCGPHVLVGGVLEDLLLDLDQSITQLLDSLRYNLAFDGQNQKVSEVLGQVRVGGHEWYLLIYPPGTAYIPSPHEATRRNPGPTAPESDSGSRDFTRIHNGSQCVVA